MDDGKTTVVPGTSNTYTITITNNGPSTVSSLTLTDTIPTALLNPIFGAPSAGSYDAATRVWSGLSLASGQSVTLTLTGTIDPTATGPITNTVTVSPPTGTTDPTPGNNSAQDIDTIPVATTLATTASPNVTLSNSSVTLSDRATLSGGSNPTGNIVFTLSGPGGFSFTETDTVNGDGTYNASLTLPTTGTVAGAYSWTAQYTPGDANNLASTAPAEPTVVSAASPGLTTTASPGGPVGSTLTDSALLSGGYFPTGTITFELFPNGVAVGTPAFTNTIPVSGDGTYTSASFTTTVASMWLWQAVYNGDANNNPVTANGESVIAEPQADLSVTTDDSKTSVVPGTSNTYTITVTNNGPSTVSSFNLVDTIPGDLLNATFGSPSAGSYDPGSGLWSGLSLASGQSVSIALSGVIGIDTGTLTNTVTVSLPAGVTDASPGNNVATDTDTLTVFGSPYPSPPPATSANMILRRVDGLYAIYDIGNNASLTAHPLAQVGTDWQFAGLGGFQVGDTADMLLRSASTGGFELYDISNNNITNAGFLGNVGMDWQVMGFGNFSSRGETDMILRNANAGGLEVYDIANNAITNAAFIGAVGLDWQFSGVGNFSGVPGETDLLLRNSTTGALEVYDINNNQVTGAAALGTVGLEWQFAGVAPVRGAGTSDLVLRNVNTGAFEAYDIANNQIVGAASLGQVGLEWQPGGFAADPAPASTDGAGSTAQLVQAMAGFGGGSGAADGLNTAPLNADASQQTFLTQPHA